jgi:uncharacterized peroxidase-related enzyme
MTFRPETGKPLSELVEVLLRSPNSLTAGERELLATSVSAGNDCLCCRSIHGAIAAHHFEENEALVENVVCDFEQAAISEKLKALLAIAHKVREAGKTSRRRMLRGQESKAPLISRFTTPS